MYEKSERLECECRVATGAPPWSICCSHQDTDIPDTGILIPGHAWGGPALAQCWTSVSDAGPALSQVWTIVSHPSVYKAFLILHINQPHFVCQWPRPCVIRVLIIDPVKLESNPQCIYTLWWTSYIFPKLKLFSAFFNWWLIADKK